MNILIKGLDIPKSEHERITVQIGSDGAVYLVTDFELKAEVYKFNAVEVPEPHGRLIDADALKEYGIMAADYCVDLFVPVDDIDDAPTIIEAEE